MSFLLPADFPLHFIYHISSSIVCDFHPLMTNKKVFFFFWKHRPKASWEQLFFKTISCLFNHSSTWWLFWDRLSVEVALLVLTLLWFTILADIKCVHQRLLLEQSDSEQITLEKRITISSCIKSVSVQTRLIYVVKTERISERYHVSFLVKWRLSL